VARVKYLFIHQNAPGQYLHAIQRLTQDHHNEVATISLANTITLPGTRKVVYAFPPRKMAGIHAHAQEFEVAVARAETVATTCAELSRLGFQPDIILGHSGWGELLNVKDVWPDTPVAGYYEFYYRTAGADVGFDPEFPLAPANRARVRAKNAVNLLSLQVTDIGQTPTPWQRSTYPAWARGRLRLVPEGVDLDACSPDPAARLQPLTIGKIPPIPPGVPLLTYVARNLEPYRGFHVLMRALPRLLAARRDLRVMIVGADGVSYGSAPRNGTSYRQALLQELGSAIDPDRVHFAGRIPYSQHLAVLRRSDVHVYLTYPFVASWSLREAIACGCRIVASDTTPVRDFLVDRRTALLTPFLDSQALADRVLEVLEDRRLGDRLGAAARRMAMRRLGLDRHHAAFDALVDATTGRR
jgi:glycosyltransferase involved in cell wall biosynthesis